MLHFLPAVIMSIIFAYQGEVVATILRDIPWETLMSIGSVVFSSVANSSHVIFTFNHWKKMVLFFYEQKNIANNINNSLNVNA